MARYELTPDERQALRQAGVRSRWQVSAEVKRAGGLLLEFKQLSTRQRGQQTPAGKRVLNIQLEQDKR